MGQPHAVIKLSPQHLLYIQAAGSNTILDLEWYSREVMPFHGRKLKQDLLTGFDIGLAEVFLEG